MTDWIDNTGTVPDGVEADTVIEVEYRDGELAIWDGSFVSNRTRILWVIQGGADDVIRWRKVPA